MGRERERESYQAAAGRYRDLQSSDSVGRLGDVGLGEEKCSDDGKILRFFVLGNSSSNTVLHRNATVQFTERSVSFRDADMMLGPRQTGLGKRCLPIR